MDKGRYQDGSRVSMGFTQQGQVMLAYQMRVLCDMLEDRPLLPAVRREVAYNRIVLKSLGERPRFRKGNEPERKEPDHE